MFKKRTSTMPLSYQISAAIAWGLVFAGTFLALDAHQKKADRQAFRDAYMANGTKVCTETQMKAPGNAGISPETIAAYCKCYSQGTLDTLTDDQMSRVQPGSPAPADVLSVVATVGAKCAADVKAAQK